MRDTVWFSPITDRFLAGTPIKHLYLYSVKHGNLNNKTLWLYSLSEYTSIQKRKLDDYALTKRKRVGQVSLRPMLRCLSVWRLCVDWLGKKGQPLVLYFCFLSFFCGHNSPLIIQSIISINYSRACANHEHAGFLPLSSLSQGDSTHLHPLLMV